MSDMGLKRSKVTTPSKRIEITGNGHKLHGEVPKRFAMTDMF